MRKSIATVSVSGSLSEKLVAIARAGFDAVEIFESDLVNAQASPEEVRRQATDLGLAIDLYQPFRDFEAMSPKRLAANLKRAERKFNLMERLGTSTMLVCSNVSPEVIHDDALAAEHLYVLAERAGERGITIAYEALAWGRHVSEYQHSWRIVHAANHPHLGVCLDSFHILSRRSDPSGIRRIPGEKIAFLQLADAPIMAMDVLPWSRHYRCFPGQGGFDLTAFLEHVAVAGYRGSLSLEIFSDTFRQAMAEPTAREAMRSLLYLEESLRLRLDDSPDISLREHLELFAPPAAPALSSVAFAEISVSREGAPPLTDMLRAMGFSRGGKHRTKAAELWRSGGAALVVNAESDDAPDEPEMTALGLRTAQAAAVGERAEAYLAPLLPRRRSSDEADLPSILMPAGTTLLFCEADDEWLRDFDAEAAGAEEGFTGIDHVTVTAPFDAFDDSVLLLRSLLAMQPGADAEIAHPFGLVHSRPLVSRAGRASGDSRGRADEQGIRIALNMPPMDSHGIVAQHIAFGCDDIFAAGETLRTLGAPILTIPQNYYEDLQARLDLDAVLLERLQELGVMYDRDPDGEFFHFYSALAGQHLFFEVVQRSGRYAGYGAANASTRMAAQRI